MKKLLLLILAQMLAGKTNAQQTLTTDGAWCWFSDPRAVYADAMGSRIITGWVTKQGDIQAAMLDASSGKSETVTLYEKLEVDDHDNPAFAILPDKNIIALYTWHGRNEEPKGVIQNTTSKPLDISTFSKAKVFKPKTDSLLALYKKDTYTYANPFILKKEKNKLYCFGRWIGYKPNMITSTDNGQTWSEPKVVITSKVLDTNNRPYVKYCSDGNARIHLIFTDGHPAVEPLNSVYYCYYENNAFWRADNSLICKVDALPFHPSDATLVYKATPETGKAWIFDITADAKGRPAILYARYPTNEQHQYFYAKFDGKSWVDNKVVEAGKWFPHTPAGQKEREVNYSGGMTFDPISPETIYFSHQIDGIFEISRGVTQDAGKSWKISPVTRNSELDNVRPFVPRNKTAKNKTVLLWMQNRSYIHYTDYDSSILYKIIQP
ncbi:BNR-4 repeat-containing protein [Dyadobacter luticola]|uniref:Exo-alpha-sialidase n=1 Tax=Dyadobacter luticola TaxID=1979387 RepID=A0A5R9L5T4_9BACT|nr:BNR-4 repeat-containing protein [Dyadobacter luticola]TLV03942.1 hypothetical protein FEN17_10260 [Dyadobacter luticola]